MKVLIQRVTEASVSVDGKIVGVIEKGLVILLGIHHTDNEKNAEWLATKCINLRVFPDHDGKMNISTLDVNGDFLVISQFTLYGNAEKGNRPSYIDSAPPQIAEPLYDYFCTYLENISGRKIQKGVFGADMKVKLLNDGPVTLIIER